VSDARQVARVTEIPELIAEDEGLLHLDARQEVDDHEREVRPHEGPNGVR
jgi:hypothetical protein